MRHDTSNGMTRARDSLPLPYFTRAHKVGGILGIFLPPTLYIAGCSPNEPLRVLVFFSFFFVLPFLYNLC